MTSLSPQAQAVLDASNLLPGKDSYLILAAALRAAADQLAYGHGSWAGTSAIIDEDKLLAIADELEGNA
jgi:hypothetical protein